MINKVRTSLVICIAVSTLSVSAQVPSKKKPHSNSRTSASEKQSAQIQRGTAIQMLTSLVDEADRYKDETLRAQTHARVADTLWDDDQDLSRELFGRAWKVAERIDKENERLAQEVRAKAVNSRDNGLVMLSPTSSVRMEVLKLIAKRNSDFAEGFLAKIVEVKDEDKSRDNGATFDPSEPSLAVAKRLEVATLLLDQDVETAVAFAQPALKEVTSPGIIFLCKLRERNRDLADRLYREMLIRAGDDLRSDATTVSLLTTYLFTPNLIVTATRRGRILNPFAGEKQSEEYSPELRSTFFRIAASVLRRPSPLPNQETSAGRAGTAFTIARLLPLFEQYAPSHIAALKTQLLLLERDVPPDWIKEDDLMLRAGLTSSAPEAMQSNESIEQQISKASSPAERDLLYLKAIQAGAATGDPRIRNFAGKIEDLALKEQARTFADLAVVRNALNKKDSDQVLRIVREGYLSSLQRVWALATLASNLGKTDVVEAMDILNEATMEAMRIKLGDPNRVYALVCVAQSLLDLDRVKIQDMAFDVIKALNAVSDFNLDGGKLHAQVRARNLIAMISSKEPSFSIASFFERLSKQDLQLAIALATDVRPDAVRATATLEIAGRILKHPKNASVSVRN